MDWSRRPNLPFSERSTIICTCEQLSALFAEIGWMLDGKLG
jgi:hypothetical protein